MNFIDRPIYVEDVILVVSVLANIALALGLFLTLTGDERRRARVAERITKENIRNPVYGMKR